MTRNVLRSPDAAAAATGGQNGAGQAPLDPRASLALLLSQADEPAAPEPEVTATSSAEDDPEAASAPAAEVEPGEDTLPPESPETPEGEGESPSGEPSESVPENSNVELTQAIAGLSPKERQAALDLVKQLQPGEIPRIAKLVAEKHQLNDTIESLQKQVEELESAPAPAAVRESGALPESVVKLKTVEAVDGRQGNVESWIEQITDLLDTNPSPDAVYDIAEGVQKTREQLILQRATLRNELKALGQRRQQIQGGERMKQLQQQYRTQTRSEHPWLNDAEHPRTKAVQAALSGPLAPLKNTPNPEYLAAVIIEGEKVLKAELAQRRGVKPTAKVVVPAGKVPLGKPHAGGGAGPANGEGGGVRKALELHGKTGSRSSFAAVLAAQKAP